MAAVENCNEQPKPYLELKDILNILPHRYPFLLVDRVLTIDLEEKKILGLKNVTFNEGFFQGHFPGAPIMPGVLILEAMAQTAGILVHQKGHVGKSAVIINVNNAKFRNPVKPGDVLLLDIEGIHIGSKVGRVKGRALIQDTVVAAEAEIAFALVEKDQF